jgi:hypothetical protein
MATEQEFVMKTVLSILILAVIALQSGCTTSAKVQKMIDASHRDYLNRTESLQTSVDVLKKSSMTGLEMAKENAAAIKELQLELEKTAKQMKIFQGYAEAAKIMSAANTVKLSDLEEAVNRNQESTEQITAHLSNMDRLYEEVMVANFKSIADSAAAAIESIKAGGWTASTNAPVLLNEPIEIIAPDTSAAASNIVISQ